MYSFSVLRGRPGPHRTQGLLLGPVLLQFLGPPSLSLQCHPLPTAHTALLSSQCLPFLGLNKFMISMSLQWPTSSISSSPDLYFQPPSGHTTCLSHNTADSIHIPMQLIIFPPKLASHPASYTHCSSQKPKNQLWILTSHPKQPVRPQALLILPLKDSGTNSISSCLWFRLLQ